MITLNVVGCGRVGRALARLLRQHGLCTVQDLVARSEASAREAAAFVGAGRAVADLSGLRPADLWLIGVPDAQVAAVAKSLAERVAVAKATAAPVAFHCSGFLPAAALAPLQALGWTVASVHPALSFASAETGVRQFPGTPCGVEGDAQALAVLEPLFAALGARCFPVDGTRKALYHGAAVICSNFTVVLQALAREAWAEAGVPPDMVPVLHAALLRGTVENTLALGPAGAITGPAARGDTPVVQAQGAAIAAWHPEAGEIYRLASVLARRLAVRGSTLPDAVAPARSARAAAARPVPVHLLPARFPDDAERVRAIFREYAESLGFDLGFQDFDAELADLPGKYAEPAGCVLLAVDGDAVLGCVALRPSGPGVAEMKRLYVRPGLRGLNLGRRLAEAVCDFARAAGYERIRLDTLADMAAARGIYASMGFVPTAPYVFNPIEGAIFLERVL